MTDVSTTAPDVRTHAGPLPPIAADEVRALATRAAAHDGVSPLSEQPLLWLESDEARVEHLLARDERGVLVGYAQLDTTLAAAVHGELVVDPDHRRQGIGRALLAAVPAAPEGTAEPVLHVWAHGDLPAARAFAAATQMPVVRELWQMRLEPLTGGRHVPLPAGVKVRAFVPGQDEEEWRRVNSRAFAHHPEQGRMTSADLRAREREPWFDPAGFLLAERDGKLLGSVLDQTHPAGEHGPDPVGEIYVVGVDPDAQGLGLGGALTAAGLDHLAARGLGAAILYTEADNEVAIRTYRRAGFERSATDVMFGSDTRRSPTGATMSP